jgi:hypothetical protein
MTKNRLLAGAAILALHSAFVALLSLTMDKPSIYAQRGFGILVLHSFSFLGLTCVALTVRQRYWPIGSISAALASLMRSCITAFPGEKGIFITLTLAVSALSAGALLISWQRESFDMSWWDQRRGKKSSAVLILGIVAVIVILVIWVIWGRG